MDIDVALLLLSCGSLVAVAALLLAREPRSTVKHVLFVALCLLAANAALAAVGRRAEGAGTERLWLRVRYGVGAMVPGAWLAFTLTYARARPREFLRRWRLVLAVLVVVPLACVVGFPGALVLPLRVAVGPSFSTAAGAWRLGPAGVLHGAACLLGFALALMNLERTLRASTGTMRWRIKFMVMGAGLIMAARLYEMTQALVYTASPGVAVLDVTAAATVPGCALIAVSLMRSPLQGIDLYVSETMLFRSFTVWVMTLYLFVVGVLAGLANRFGGLEAFPVKTFLAFMACVLLALGLLSDRLRQRARRAISRVLSRPRYDCRKLWTTFYELTAQPGDRAAYCRRVAAAVSRTFDILSVSIWLQDEAGQGFSLAGSTSVASAGTPGMPRDLALDTQGLTQPFDIDVRGDAWAMSLKRANPGHFESGGNRLCVPIRAGSQLIGLMVLGDRVNGSPYTAEELEILTTIGGHAGNYLLNMSLAERLLAAKQMEAFQAMSAFFVHDLKNTASILSLMLQNMPKHYADPAFREDALKSIGKGVDKINDLIRRFTALRQGLDIRPVPTAMRPLVEEVVDALGPAISCSVEPRFGELPPVPVDREQLRKVLTNLVINANEASGGTGTIRIETERQGDHAVVSVIDNGCGMSEVFVGESLFRPFRSTKRNGMGIGMFHSKTIVEAHNGRIEVRSEEGKGTTFRVHLPLGGG